MSPAALDVRSPITSPLPKPSSTPQNPNAPVPEMLSSSTFNFGAFASNGNESQCQCGPNVPSRSGRSRPRLVKLRKQHARSRTGSAESGPGANPFCSVSDGPSASNGFSFSNGDCGGVGFVFGARRSGLDMNLDNGVGESCEMVINLSCDERGDVNTGNGRAFDKLENLDNGVGDSGEKVSNLNCDERGEVNTGNGTEFDKLESVSFMFGAKKDDPGSSLLGEKSEFCENVRVMVSEEKGNRRTETETECRMVDNMGFAFGDNRSGLGSDANPEMRECGGFKERLSTDDSGKMKLESELTCNAGSVLGESDSAPNLSTKYKESAERVEKLGDNEGFVFCADLGDFGSTPNSGNREYSENEGKSGCAGIGSTELLNEAEERNNNDMGFVFGSSWLDPNSNLNSGRRSSSGNLERLVSDVGMKMKVESATEFDKVKVNSFGFHTEESWSSDKDHDKGIFLFGSSSKKGSSLTECKGAKCQHEMKLSNGNVGDCNTNSSSQNDNLSSEFSGKCKLVFESSNSNANVSSRSFEFKPSAKTTDSNKNSFTDAGTASVFKIYGNVSSSFSGSSETNSCDQCPEGPSASERTNGDNHESSDRNHIIFGSVSKTIDASIGTSSSKQFTFQAGVGESVDVGKLSQCQININTQPNAAAVPCSFSSTGLGFQPNGPVSEAASVGGVKKNGESSFSGTPDGFGVCFEDFQTPLLDPSSLRASLFPEFSVNRSIKDKRSRKTRGKSKKPSMSKQWPGKDHLPKESSSQENPDSSECYSPMDFSPYEKTTVADPHSGETSVTSNDSFHVNNSAPCASNGTVPVDSRGEDLAAAGGLDDKGDQICREPFEENFRHHGERIFVHDFLFKGSGSGSETPWFSSKSEHVSDISAAGGDSEEARAGFGLNIERQESDCRTPCFASGFENMKGKNFTFLASSSAQSSSIMGKRWQRRNKNRMKVAHDTFVITPSPNVEFGSSDQFTPQSSTPFLFDVVGKSEAHEQFKQGHISASAATQETCEKWRIRGNEAYKNGDLSKAEDFYTQGIISIPSNERSGCCLKPLLLCYSNRATARMHLGRIREALGDCVMATALDPDFLKVQMRAANCHLLLGEVETAMQYFNKCLESRTGVCLDRRIVIDSADGIQKAQKVAEYSNRSAKLLEQRTTDAALSALEMIAEALSVSLYSEKLLEMKAEALCLLRRYEVVIQLCEHSLHLAERNFASGNSVANMDGSGCENYSFVRLWRWFFISKSYFHLGRLEAALALLEKLEQVRSIKDMYACKSLESSVSLAVTIRELLSHKNAGNEAFKSGRYTEAVEHYTVALSSNIGSRPFAAICLCNRGAAHQALGQITDAIADCSLAIALDGNYVKALSRRATLHEMIRDYGQAGSDLQRLVSILEKQSDDKAKESSLQGRSNGSVKELRHAHRRMPLMEEEAKKGIPLNFYLILGIKPYDTSSDIKKAYRKAALKHHPDKAGQFLARSESGDEGRLWKEISMEVHKDADRLFKMIGEAYAVLSDPTKRSQYDLEEDMRKEANESKESSGYRKPSDFQSPGRSSYRRPDFHSSPCERSSYGRNSRESWKTYGNSYSRW